MVAAENFERRGDRRDLCHGSRNERLIRIVLCQDPLVGEVDDQVADVALGEPGALEQRLVGLRGTGFRRIAGRGGAGQGRDAHEQRGKEPIQSCGAGERISEAEAIGHDSGCRWKGAP